MGTKEENTMQLQQVVEKRAPVAGKPLERVILVEPRYPGLHVFSKFKLPRLGLPLLGAILFGRNSFYQ